jgi:hypothetical protein
MIYRYTVQGRPPRLVCDTPGSGSGAGPERPHISLAVTAALYEAVCAAVAAFGDHVVHVSLHDGLQQAVWKLLPPYDEAALSGEARAALGPEEPPAPSMSCAMRAWRAASCLSTKARTSSICMRRATTPSAVWRSALMSASRRSQTRACCVSNSFSRLASWALITRSRGTACDLDCEPGGLCGFLSVRGMGHLSFSGWRAITSMRVCRCRVRESRTSVLKASWWPKACGGV